MHVISKMMTDPDDEAFEEEEISDKFRSCENLPNEITGIMCEMEPNMKIIALKVQQGWQQIGGLERQQQKLIEYCRNSMMKHAKDADTKMIADQKASVKKKEGIVSDVAQATKHLEKIREENLKKEKDLREKRNVVEERLATIIAKYNTEMKKKEKILNKLITSYEKESATLKDLTEIYDKQEAKYNELMKEKADYEQAIWQAKLYEVQKKIAARRIQRFYRSYLAFMLAHGKRGKRGKGKRRK